MIDLLVPLASTVYAVVTGGIFFYCNGFVVLVKSTEVWYN